MGTWDVKLRMASCSSRLPYVRSVVLAALFVSVSTGSASGLTIDSDTIVETNIGVVFPETVEVVSGSNPPTRVTILAGGELGGNLLIRDDSVVTMQGGTLRGVQTFGTSVFEMVEGTARGDMGAAGDSTLSLLGGTISEGAGASDRGHLLISGGVTLSGASARDHSVIDILGGMLADENGVSADDQSTVNIWGGAIVGEDQEIEVNDSGVVNVFGFGLQLVDHRLRGTLADGTAIDYRVELSGAGQVVLHEIPEANALGLMLLGMVTLVLALPRRLCTAG